MSLEELTRILPPPSYPVYARGVDDWGRIEEELGMIFPEDYREFVALYGAGSIDDFLWVFVPFCPNKYLDLSYNDTKLLGALRSLQDEFPETSPYPLNPPEDGVFPWAITDNGDELYWRVRHGRVEKKVLVLGSRSNDWQEFDLTTVDFLTNVLNCTISVRRFPEDFPDVQHSFRKAREVAGE
jgi:hypothetical protein